MKERTLRQLVWGGVLLSVICWGCFLLVFVPRCCHFVKTQMKGAQNEGQEEIFIHKAEVYR